MTTTEPWKCNKCTAVVFIPTSSSIEGGVCTQARRGCKGAIQKMDAGEASAVRTLMKTRGIVEQPWLTLRFAEGIA